MNVVCLMGRLTAAPELKRTQSGIATCTFNLAVDRGYQKAGEDKKTDFITIVAWRQTAEFICNYFDKGNKIALQGSLQTRSYEDKNGNKRTVYEVIASNVEFCESKSSKQANKPNTGAADDWECVDDGEDLPF